MGSRERKKRERAQMRRRILAAARELFEVNGYQGTTMRAIADRIDYTPTILYEHFQSKEELISEVVAEDFRILTRGLVETGEVEDPVARLVRAMGKYVDFALNHPRHYELTFTNGGPRDGEVGVAPGASDASGTGVSLEEARRTVYVYLRLTCQEAIAMGRFRAEFQDADEVARMLWSAMHGAVSLHRAGREDPWMDRTDVRRTALRTCATLIRGLSPRTGGVGHPGS